MAHLSGNFPQSRSRPALPHRVGRVSRISPAVRPYNSQLHLPLVGPPPPAHPLDRALLWRPARPFPARILTPEQKPPPQPAPSPRQPPEPPNHRPPHPTHLCATARTAPQALSRLVMCPKSHAFKRSPLSHSSTPHLTIQFLQQ
jgi:hypothetical protein